MHPTASCGNTDLFSVLPLPSTPTSIAIGQEFQIMDFTSRYCDRMWLICQWSRALKYLSVSRFLTSLDFSISSWLEVQLFSTFAFQPVSYNSNKFTKHSPNKPSSNPPIIIWPSYTHDAPFSSASACPRIFHSSSSIRLRTTKYKHLLFDGRYTCKL